MLNYSPISVSYTHLDVYKRQQYARYVEDIEKIIVVLTWKLNIRKLSKRWLGLLHNILTCVDVNNELKFFNIHTSIRMNILWIHSYLPRSNNTDRIMGAVLRTVRCLHLRRIRSRFHSIWLPVLRCSKPVSVYGRIWPVTNSITVRNTAPINTVRNGVPFWSTWVGGYF